jgi:catalase
MYTTCPFLAASAIVLAAGLSDVAHDAAAAGLHPLESYEGGSKPVEDLFTGFLVSFFGRTIASGEPLLRGTHAVGTCVGANLIIDDIKGDADLPEALALGGFAEPGSTDIRVRFSNGLGSPQDPRKGFDDKDYDARAMAFQMKTSDGRLQDFVLQNSPIFPIWPIEGFALTVQLGIAKAKGQEKSFLGQLTPHQGRTLANVLDKVRQYQRQPGVVVPTFTPRPDAYRLETYWSGKAHRIGTYGMPVKYVARPCASNAVYVPTRAVDFGSRERDFLQRELIRHIENPIEGEIPACFDFYIQPLNAAVMTGPDGRVLPEAEHWRWVEDTTLEWKEAEAPGFRVGRITLTGPIVSAETCNDPDNFINSSINTLPEHAGLGRISRAETLAAKASVERRRRNQDDAH